MSIWRAPALLVLCDGTPLPGVSAVQVTSNNHFAADTWRLQAAISADPAGLSAWDARTGSVIEVMIGLAAGGWTSLITGQIDHMTADPIEGGIAIEGRDLTARFIAARTSEAFANQTASEVAALLAGRQGMAAQVTETTTPIGRYYGDEHDRVTLARYARASTEWDLLVWLAEQEGFDVYVSGTTLTFQPPSNGPVPELMLQATPTATAQPNVSLLRLERAFTLSGPIDVTVQTWNSQSQSGFSQTASRDGTGPASSYVFVRPNMTSGAALALAQQKLSALAQHQYVLTAHLPGELTLTARDEVGLTGTGSSFDQSYTIDKITRRFDMRTGFTEIIRATSSGQAGS